MMYWPSEKEMVGWVKEHSCHAPKHQPIEDAICRLIKGQGELEKKMNEWKGRAKEIMDELDTDDSSGALLEDIRNFDFGKKGK